MKNKTNWDSYYSHPSGVSGITRKITGNLLLKYINKYCNSEKKKNFSIIELGGANSCFYKMIDNNIKPFKYIIIDNNELGLNKTKSSNPTSSNIYLYKKDILNFDLKIKADLVFSIGLIEHFNPIETAKIIKAHFDLLKPEGIAIITFPTSTFLYKITRKFITLIGKWIFYDERPLTFNEVLKNTDRYGELLVKKMNWKIFLTQGIVVVKKKHGTNK